MEMLINQVKYFAALVAQTKMMVRWGIVTSYSPAKYAVKVTLQPEEIETGWLPLTSPWVGNGWGLIAPPSVGDMCEIQFQEGSINTGFACSRGFGNQTPPPQDADVKQSGSFLMKSKTGALLKFKDDGSVEVKSAPGTSLVLDSDTSVQIGDTTLPLEKFVTEAFKDLYNNHTHDTSSVPNPPHLGAGELTTIAEGN